ncbi:LacI family DNA-binding transcriptional regulator, partial [Streptomyces sp. ActVer]|uniref:LacI family DNA-binding transcriptional regulator n=1 Tax=Streptomyces sp. ActVer TaxID=3014558 RepID=UPI0022B336C9
MTAAAPADPGDPTGSGDPTGPGDSVGLDVGLLAPGRAGSPAESATGDRAFLQALLDAEAALTLKDVAERAGVSIKTVSNVVNNYPHV